MASRLFVDARPRGTICAIGLLGALLASPRFASADKGFHGAVAAGGYSEIVHQSFGARGSLELWPGGRLGGRVDVYAVEAGDAFRLEASGCYQLGSSRPHLFVYLHAGGGWAPSEDAALVSGGLAGQLGLQIGPLALALDGTVQAVIHGDSWQLGLVNVLSLAAAW